MLNSLKNQLSENDYLYVIVDMDKKCTKIYKNKSLI